ncbi:hypothetical protein AVEN_248737-1 [Araneus ventricosus]|uniref:Uncharacterized protein n=1 Tax=Araneus ventricosus TaxID=182803 RepID=A0A4Y2C1U1_ARAVE|nr:hypothetical protein AVEN_156539-1 [Araneus ventricosus]GBL97576.1 hypothetical protein AVEN_248737-1 [Araneus ventricosus]
MPCAYTQHGVMGECQMGNKESWRRTLKLYPKRYCTLLIAILHIWREERTCYHASTPFKESGDGILVFGGIALTNRNDLNIFQAGSDTGTSFTVHLPQMCLIRAAMGPHFLFKDDNSACHYALTTAELLGSKNIQHIDWTAKNSDLSPIEDIKDILGRELASGHHPPATTGATRGIGQQSFSISSSE